MWTANRKREGRTEECAADQGVVTLGGDPAAVYLGGERRWVSLYTPGGYQWRPKAGDKVLVVKAGDHRELPCLVGKRPDALSEEDELPPGSVRIHSGTGVVLLVAFCTALEYAAAQLMFPGELALSQLLSLNGGLLALHLFMAGFSFLCSCIFNESKYALGVSAGVLSVSYLLQMLANMGGRLENLKYATFFTLFRPAELLEGGAWGGVGVLLALALLCSLVSILVFCKKDMPV